VPALVRGVPLEPPPVVGGAQGFDGHEQRLRAALRARVIGAAIWLLPPALGSVAIGLSALLA
jgi:hypothetical protein